MLMDPPAAMVSLPTDSNEQLSGYARTEVDSAGGSNNITHPQLTTTTTMRDNSQLLLIIAYSTCVRYKGVSTRITKGLYCVMHVYSGMQCGALHGGSVNSAKRTSICSVYMTCFACVLGVARTSRHHLQA